MAGAGTAKAAARLLKRVQGLLDEPNKVAYPGIYDNPRAIAERAEAQVAPEDPAMKRLFGVQREDLAATARSRKGNMEFSAGPENARGSKAAKAVMTKKNARRLQDVLGEAQRQPGLRSGMEGWYVMDPAYQRLVELVGPDEAKNVYTRFNALTGMASSGSDVLTELNRGTAANWLSREGRFGDFTKFAGRPVSQRGTDFPDDVRAVLGHPYHKTTHATPMQRFVDTGEVQMGSAKVPSYILASGVPETGFQTSFPVGDAHWSRAVGLPDVRTNQAFQASASVPEMTTLAPWWRDEIAGKVGMEAVPAQALAWGAFSPQTGVTTPIGAPKLELLSQQIMKTAARLGVSPETARDMVLMGKTHAGKVDPTLAAGMAGAAGLGAVSYGLLDE